MGTREKKQQNYSLKIIGIVSLISVSTNQLRLPVPQFLSCLIILTSQACQEGQVNVSKVHGPDFDT